MRRFLLAGAAAMLAAGAAMPRGAALAQPPAAHILVTKEQRSMEEQARRLLQTDAMKREMARAAAYLRALPNVSTEDAADIDGYVHELALCVALAVINSDPARPRVLFNGFPGTQYGLVNPDNIYRYIPVSSTSVYEVTGRLHGSTHVSFQLTDGAQFVGGRLSKDFGQLTSDNLKSRADGSFTITLGPAPAAGRANYLQVPPGAVQLMIRDTMTDWSKWPMELRVRRKAGPAHQPARPEELAQRTAAALAASIKLWVEIPQKHNYNSPPNTLPRFNQAATGSGGLVGQVNTGGNFKLSADEALVITARKGSARYLGFQLGSNWYVPFDYAAHSSSLNNHQVVPNPDGSYTYVIALRDPGVANWLDPVGHPTGVTLMRWQGLAAPLATEDAPVVRLVRFEDLARALPPGTPMVTPAERARQLQERQRQVLQRRAAAVVGY